jgi:hypothetical protein
MKHILIFFFFVPCLWAQQRHGSTKIVRAAPEAWMQWQVKHLSQWIERYNHERLPNGTAFTDSSRRLYPREQYIRGLFNASDARLQKNGNTLYKLQVEEFIQESCGSKPILIGARPSVSATVPMLVQVGTHKDTLTVCLQKRYRPDSVAYWEVVRVRLSKGFKLPKQMTSPDSAGRLYLPPNAHEVAFLPLRQLLLEHRSIVRLTPDNGQSQPELLQLETLLCEQQIGFGAMLPPTLLIDTQRGWKVQLREFVRETDNSGWLVTGLWKE